MIFLAILLGVTDPTCTVKDICTANYTASVRPPASYTNKLKKQQMKDMGLSGEPCEFEEDHRIALELCGSPRDPNNLVPQKWDRARKKDVMETRFKKAVCAGKMSLEEAQKLIVGFE